jgi:hypothetical protein
VSGKRRKREGRKGTNASDSGMERMGSLVVVIVQPCREIERVPVDEF